MQPFFSIIVVCLNPGEKLKCTLESIKKQTFCDYEIVIKDGFSKDGSLHAIGQVFPEWKEWKEEDAFSAEADTKAYEEVQPKVWFVQEKDTGIYEAMNQAAGKAKGKYVYFLNCGDLFYAESVLEEMAAFIRGSEAYGQQIPGIYYGNIYERLTCQQVASNPQIDAFGCYRNVPCHQACFYSRELLLAHPFETRYRVRADYEQFLWCFFTDDLEKRVVFAHKDILIADYEGGGFSEMKENRKRSCAEHKEITKKYMSKVQRLKYKAVMLLTLARLRTYLAENEKTAGFYNRLKEKLYRLKK